MSPRDVISRLVKRLLALLMMLTMTLVSATSVAAAVCQHRNAQEHAAALNGDDGQAAAEARAEDMARAHNGKNSEAVDFGAFAFAAFILPAPSTDVPAPPADPLPLRPASSAAPAGRVIAPLLEPPAA